MYVKVNSRKIKKFKLEELLTMLMYVYTVTLLLTFCID